MGVAEWLVGVNLTGSFLGVPTRRVFYTIKQHNMTAMITTTTTSKAPNCLNCGKQLEYVIGSCRNCGAERPSDYNPSN